MTLLVSEGVPVVFCPPTGTRGFWCLRKIDLTGRFACGTGSLDHDFVSLNSNLTSFLKDHTSKETTSTHLLPRSVERRVRWESHLYPEDEQFCLRSTPLVYGRGGCEGECECSVPSLGELEVGMTWTNRHSCRLSS